MGISPLVHAAAARLGGQRQLAEAMGVAPSSVSRWASGGPMDPWSCVLLAQVGGWEAADVLEAAGHDPAPLLAVAVLPRPSGAPPLDPEVEIVGAALPLAAPHIRRAVVTLLEPYARPKGPRRLAEADAPLSRNTTPRRRRNTKAEPDFIPAPRAAQRRMKPRYPRIAA